MEKRVFFIYANPHKPDTISAARELAEKLEKNGAQAAMEGWLHEKVNTGVPLDLARGDVAPEAVISLGGDGTMLRAISASARHRAPVLGVNMGHVGFLMETDIRKSDEMISKLLKKDYFIDDRMMLAADIKGKGTYYITNDFALVRGDTPSSIIIDAYADDEKIFRVHGDGVLVSTPTGTTGYSLSAGGPVIDPTLECILVMPVCSHVLHHRPVVLPKEKLIRLHVKADEGRSNQVLIDGQVSLLIKGEAEATLGYTNERARFIRFEQQKFLTRLRQKQAEWSKE